jgi:2-aminoadipate transaminase
MNWNDLYSQRSALMRRSAVRDLLKIAAQPGMISFAGGLPPPELFATDEIEHAAREVLRRNPETALQYGETEGMAELRDWIAEGFTRRGVALRRENILITTGSQQGLDLIGRVLLDHDDHVLVENPTYLAALGAWRPTGARFVPMPSDGFGVLADQIRSPLGNGAKLVYCIPNFQNPRGTTMAVDRRAGLLAATRGRNVAVVEDDPYGDLRFEGEAIPSLIELEKADGDHGQVVYLGTFSKILAPGLRVGWVAGPAPVIEKLALAKQSADLHTSTLCQAIALEMARTGALERQLPALRRCCRQRRDVMIESLESCFPVDTKWTRPAGGMFLWLEFPTNVDAALMLRNAIALHTAFVPGREFYIDGQGKNTARLNFSRCPPDQIREGVRRLAAALAAARIERVPAAIRSDITL